MVVSTVDIGKMSAVGDIEGLCDMGVGDIGLSAGVRDTEWLNAVYDEGAGWLKAEDVASWMARQYRLSQTRHYRSMYLPPLALTNSNKRAGSNTCLVITCSNGTQVSEYHRVSEHQIVAWRDLGLKQCLIQY